MGSYPYPRNGILKIDYEFILIFKKLGDAPKPTKEQKEFSKMTAEEWNTFFAGHWNFAGTRQNNHIAMFPEELPRRLIKMFSFVGETVLDPFAESGTTSLMAKKLDRYSVGYEINPDFIPIIKEKLDVNQNDINGTTYKFITQDELHINFDGEIKLLPYIFKDPHLLDKKIDIKKLQFGSKIDKDSSTTREELFKVEQIIALDKLVINGIKTKLIGIEPYPDGWKFLGEDVNNEGIKFLETKFKNNRVFMRFDENKYDDEGNLLCYLYLENKTFINAHILKNGFSKVDENYNYKLKSKFIKTFMQRDLVIQEELKKYRHAY